MEFGKHKTGYSAIPETHRAEVARRQEASVRRKEKQAEARVGADLLDELIKAGKFYRPTTKSGMRGPVHEDYQLLPSGEEGIGSLSLVVDYDVQADSSLPRGQERPAVIQGVRLSLEIEGPEGFTHPPYRYPIASFRSGNVAQEIEGGFATGFSDQGPLLADSAEYEFIVDMLKEAKEQLKT